MSPLLKSIENLAACCRMVSSTVLTVSCSIRLKRAQTVKNFLGPNELSVKTQRKHTKQKQTNKKQIQCMMQSQNRHSRSLTFNLFTFSNSPRPPLADLYTTCIYKQYKGLTAVCTERLPVCVTDRFFFRYCCCFFFYLVFLTVDQTLILEENA